MKVVCSSYKHSGGNVKLNQISLTLFWEVLLELKQNNTAWGGLALTADKLAGIDLIKQITPKVINLFGNTVHAAA
jgi:hypothetical protein